MVSHWGKRATTCLCLLKRYTSRAPRHFDVVDWRLYEHHYSVPRAMPLCQGCGGTRAGLANPGLRWLSLSVWAEPQQASSLLAASVASRGCWLEGLWLGGSNPTARLLYCPRPGGTARRRLIIHGSESLVEACVGVACRLVPKPVEMVQATREMWGQEPKGLLDDANG
jgi:hypothetical protein